MKTHFKTNSRKNSLLSKIPILLVFLITLSGCNGNERKVKKLFKRLNAREANKASSYVYPKDQAYLYVFNKQYLENDAVITFEINQLESGNKNGAPFVALKLKCNNCSDRLNKYFVSRKLVYDDLIIDTIWIKTVNEKRLLTFPWKWDAKYTSEELSFAKVTTDVLNVRSGPGTNYKVVNKLQISDRILIDKSTENKSWLKCFTFNDDGSVKAGYISADLTKTEDISFFRLGFFGKLGLLVASIIALVVVIVVIPLMLTTIFRSAEDNWTLGLILFGVLIGILFLTYQIIENVLFELFLINLPF